MSIWGYALETVACVVMGYAGTSIFRRWDRGRRR